MKIASIAGGSALLALAVASGLRDQTPNALALGIGLGSVAGIATLRALDKENRFPTLKHMATAIAIDLVVSMGIARLGGSELLIKDGLITVASTATAIYISHMLALKESGDLKTI